MPPKKDERALVAPLVFSPPGKVILPREEKLILKVLYIKNYMLGKNLGVVVGAFLR